MPWSINKDARCPPSKPWAVIKKSDNSKVGCHESRESAQKQVQALHASEEKEMKQTTDVISDVLQHYGVKGMRWGVIRRNKPSGGYETVSVSPEAKARSATVSKIKSSGLQSVSNKELQDAITRINLEMQYSRLAQQPSKIQKGQKVVKGMLTAGKTVNEVVSLVNSPAGKMIRTGLARG